MTATAFKWKMVAAFAALYLISGVDLPGDSFRC